MQHQYIGSTLQVTPIGEKTANTRHQKLHFAVFFYVCSTNILCKMVRSTNVLVLIKGSNLFAALCLFSSTLPINFAFTELKGKKVQ